MRVLRWKRHPAISPSGKRGLAEQKGQREEARNMSLAELGVPDAGVTGGEPMRVPINGRALHRLAEVRRRQGVTRRTVARRMNTDIATVKGQEQPDADLTLSIVYAWQEVLDVPVSELLMETEEPLSSPVLKRAQLVRIMKTAAAILERSQQAAVKRMAQMLIEQLCAIMPELSGVSAWHTVGRRRTQDELGQAAQRRIAADVLRDLLE
jgi:transcriptional regulator with XRE-family HTH domain